MSKPKPALIRKDSATLTGSLVRQTAGSLMSDDTPIGTFLFGFDPTLPENVGLVFKCDEDGTRSWDQHTTEPFLLKLWAVRKVHLPAKEDREETDAIRTVLIDPEGETLVFASKGVMESLDLLRTLVGDGPYDPAIPVIVKRTELGGGRQLLKLRPDLTVIFGKSK